jgi:RNA polymerase sigma factor (sigma-70 family)
LALWQPRGGEGYHLRNIRTRLDESEFNTNGNAQGIPFAPGPEISAEIRSELSRIQFFLKTLPEIDRSAFVIRIKYELPYAEIARILQISEAAAKVKVHRVRKKLIANRMNEEAT